MIDKLKREGVTLKFIYYSLGNNRYLRSLEIDGNKKVFVNDFLNLGFIEGNKQDLEKDFNICKSIIKRQDNKIKIHLTI